MPKSQLDKQIEKQMKQSRQLFEMQKREDQRNMREQKRISNMETKVQRASSVVNGQPFICGFRVMDSTAEEILRVLIQKKPSDSMRIVFSDDIFPDYVQMSTAVELEKLVQYGMIGGLLCFDNGGTLNLLPQAITYFEDKKRAIEKQKELERQAVGVIYNNYGNMVLGDVIGSQLYVDNSINSISKDIDEKGGDDAEVLHEILDEVKELIENIQNSRSIPKQKHLFDRIANHASKHGWFYGAILQLIGTVAINMLSK